MEISWENMETPIKLSRVRLTCRGGCASVHSEHVHTGWERTFHCRWEARLDRTDIRGESITQRVCQSFKGGLVVQARGRVVMENLNGHLIKKNTSYTHCQDEAINPAELTATAN